MLKMQSVLKKISEDSNFMAEFKKAQNFNEIYNLCKKIELNITETEVKEGIREFIIISSTNSHLNNEELSAVTGGNMDFNKTKALALSALVLTGVGSASMFSNVTYASGVPEAVNINQKVESNQIISQHPEGKSLNKDATESKSDWPCLNTSEYDVANVNKTNQNLHLKIDFLRSEINFAEYKISKEDKTVFINIHGGYNASPKYEPPSDDFTVEYSVPDGVDAVYLRGNTKDDVKIVWKKDQQELNATLGSLNKIKKLLRENVDDVSLTIYYMGPGVATRAPLNVRMMINDDYISKTVVSGNELKEHIDLLDQINGDNLVPVEQKSRVDARIYYTFESKKDGILFDVAMWGKNNSMFINGIEVKENDAFYNLIIPFLPEPEAKELSNCVSVSKT